MEAFTPSPMLHMKLQSQLISQLAVTYPQSRGILEPPQIKEYLATVSAWAKAFPRVYAFDNPDMSKDAANHWITFNRYYLYTMTYFLLLAAMRPVMLKGYTSDLSELEQSICADGIMYCAKNIRVAILWAEHVDKHGGGHHFMISSVFDTVVLVCTTIMKDVNNTTPKENEIFEELDNAVALFDRFSTTLPMAKLGLDTSTMLLSKLQRPSLPTQTQKRQKIRAETTSPSPAAEMKPPVISPPRFEMAEETGSETSPEHLSRDYSTPTSLSDGWHGSTDGARGTSMSDSRTGMGSIDESLSPWPIEGYEDFAADAQPVTAADEFLVLDEQESDPPASEAVQLDDFAALWDWEALGMGTYPLEKNM